MEKLGRDEGGGGVGDREAADSGKLGGRSRVGQGRGWIRGGVHEEAVDLWKEADAGVGEGIWQGGKQGIQAGKGVKLGKEVEGGVRGGIWVGGSSRAGDGADADKAGGGSGVGQGRGQSWAGNVV